MHSKVVRDVQFSPRGDGLTLTAGMDKTLKLTSMHSNAIVLRSVCDPVSHHMILHHVTLHHSM